MLATDDTKREVSIRIELGVDEVYGDLLYLLWCLSRLDKIFLPLLLVNYLMLLLFA